MSLYRSCRMGISTVRVGEQSISRLGLLSIVLSISAGHKGGEVVEGFLGGPELACHGCNLLPEGSNFVVGRLGRRLGLVVLLPVRLVGLAVRLLFGPFRSLGRREEPPGEAAGWRDHGSEHRWRAFL